MHDVYIEDISRAYVANGVVCLVGSVAWDPDDLNDRSARQETVRLRIPIAKYQKFVSASRDTLVEAMKDGWFGEDGRKAAEAMNKEDRP